MHWRTCRCCTCCPDSSTALQPAPTTQSLPVEGSTNDVAPDELDNPAALKQAFSERCNWQLLADNLGELLKELNDAFPGEVSDRQRGALEARLATHLATSTLPMCEGSRYSRQHNLAPNSRVKLGTFLSGSGVPAPKTLEALLALYQVATKQVQTFPLGNYGGALSWPIPLSAQDRQALIDLLNTPDPALPELPLTDKQGYWATCALSLTCRATISNSRPAPWKCCWDRPRRKHWASSFKRD